ncbi:MAG: RluA family pseudouridine synthase [Mycoplasmataceae bacterium]|jgi:23S rRNA pseudouridine1911/1915/1917 synthase|nr:RluA family pseudouridine synthase [Mycoplasmataceae bacterium]
MGKILVQNLNEKIRLDKFLTNFLKQNRSYVEKLFEQQLIYVNGEVSFKKGQLIDNEMQIEIKDIEQTLNTQLKPITAKIKIVYEDNDVIVVDKAKHTLVHPTTFNEQDTIVNALLNKIKVNEFEDKLRPGVVHRLDRDTSGLLIIAKNKKAYDYLIKQVQTKSIIRKYLAIVHNNFQDKFLLIKAPIDRSKQNELRMIVSDDAKAKPAQTEVTILENYPTAALLECYLLTGRTHQIRVHMAYIHHPIFNDELYGTYDGYKNYGQFLHAYYLSFVHPTTKEVMTFNSKPDKTFQALKQKLKGDR